MSKTAFRFHAADEIPITVKGGDSVLDPVPAIDLRPGRDNGDEQDEGQGSEKGPFSRRLQFVCYRGEKGPYFNRKT